MSNEKLMEKLRVCAGGKCNERDSDGCWTDLMYEAADAIEGLQKALDAVNDAHNEGYDVGYWAGRRGYEPKWIPVTERLPKEFHDVLCYTDSYDMFIATYYGLDGDGEPMFDDNNGDYWEGNVIYWMPLPELPGEETE